MKDKIDEIKYTILSDTPDGKAKQLYWNIAIGLQDVDLLKPSEYLLEQADKNIRGELSYDEIKENLNHYYQKDNNDCSHNEQEEEADKVSLRIAQLLSYHDFRFDVSTLSIYHQFLFKDLDLGIERKYVGHYRDYNISKKEPILAEESVIYSSYNLIEDTLNYDFNEEMNTDYKYMNSDEVINHLSNFTSRIWQVHPFGEGNTRTIAVFLQKYIQDDLHIKSMNNELFKDHSLYFRNALVRANYYNRDYDIQIDDTYLHMFFSNLLFQTEYELDNEALSLENEIIKIDKLK